MTTDGSFGSLWHLLLMDGCLQPFCTLRTLPSPTDQASLAWYLHPAPTDGQDGRGGPPSQATSPQTPAASHQRQPPGPPATPTDSVCQRQEAGGRTSHTVGGRGAWEPPSAGPAGDRHAIQVLWDPGEGPASSLHLGPLAPFLADLIWKDTSLYAICPDPSMRGHAAPDRPSGLPSHMESISTLRNRGEGTRPPTPRFLEAGGVAI